MYVYDYVYACIRGYTRVGRGLEVKRIWTKWIRTTSEKSRTRFLAHIVGGISPSIWGVLRCFKSQKLSSSSLVSNSTNRSSKGYLDKQIWAMQVGLAGQKMVTRSNIHIRPMRPINVINIRKNYVRDDHFQIISSKNIRERERKLQG